MTRRNTRPLRVALFGGSFDPIHLGHVFIAKRARERLDLDRVIFVPAHRSPLKGRDATAAARHRLAMVELAIRDLPWASVSDFETSLADTSYSWRTAEHFHDHLANEGTRDVALFWILGTDQWRNLRKWSRASHLAGLVEFIVFRRNGEEPADIPPFRGHFVEGTFPASSTEIRSRLASGRHENLPIDPEVLRYITEHRLYSSPSR